MRFLDHTHAHHTRYQPFGRVIGPSQIHQPGQHSQQGDISATDGIRTHNTSKRVAVDPRLRPGGTPHHTPLKESKYSLPYLLKNTNSLSPGPDTSNAHLTCTKHLNNVLPPMFISSSRLFFLVFRLQLRMHFKSRLYLLHNRHV
jgi:hypothetical protein